MFSLANIITSLNLLSGCLGVVAVLEGRAGQAMACIGLALLFDFADGWVARKLNQASALGAELDSLADVVSFGLLPGCMMYRLMAESAPQDWSAALAYVPFAVAVFAGFRLARFNVETTGAPADFEGLPVPAQALALSGIYAHFKLDGGGFDFFDVRAVVLPVCLLASLMMVSRIPVMKFQLNRDYVHKHFLLILLYMPCLALLAMHHHLGLTLLVAAHVLYGTFYFTFTKNKH